MSQSRGDTLYHYDPLNQLKKVEYPGYTEELFYDKAGNRTRRMAQGVEELYQYDPRNRLIALTKGGVTTRFQYDNAGNLLADDKAQYSYDAFNRTIRAELFDGNVQVNRYDAEGLRYEMEENGNLVQFIFNQEREVVTEEDSTGLTRLIRVTELIARSTDAVRTYYHYASDEMGSTTHIVDDEGQVQNRYEYDAWGNITVQEETVPNRFKFTGQQLDPITQQYYLRARFYNPVIARFTQEDTYRGDGLNLYTYCNNNPVFYIDPTGYVAECLKNAYDKYRLVGKSVTEAYELAQKDYEAAKQQGKSIPAPEKPSNDGFKEYVSKEHEIRTPVKYGCPYSQLSPKQKKKLKKKLKNRTIKREEYRQLEWDRKFKNRRNRGVSRFWAAEKRRLERRKNNFGTRNWSDSQKMDILAGRVPQYGGKPLEGHHMYNAIDFPQLADDPTNIYPATHDEHFWRWHGGNYQNDTMGNPNNYNFKEEF